MHPSMKGTSRRLIGGLLATAATAALIAAAPAVACTGAGKTPSQLVVKEARQTVLCLLNQRRRQHGLSKLSMQRNLQRAAQAHSNSMDAGDFFEHGDTFGRIAGSGYLDGAGTWGYGENIRWGDGGLGTPKVAVAEWMRSAGHRANILNGRYRQIGIGITIGSPVGGPGNDTAIYTTDFGYRR
jgi:uncharacterized protein YkwD